MKMKKILALTCAAAMVFGLAACGSAATEETADLSGTISMAGSTSMEKLADRLGPDLLCDLGNKLIQRLPYHW